MKRYNFKTRAQIGWFKAAMVGTVIGLLIAPTAGRIMSSQEKAFLTDNPVIDAIGSITFGPKTKIMINKDVVALAKSEEAAKEAFQNARLAYNANGVKVLDIDVSYAQVDEEKDKKAIKGKRVLRNEKLEAAILNSFDRYADADKKLAYTMRVDDHTVTVEHMADVISILEQAQNTYDSKDAFKVGLKPPASRNVTMYEVAVEEKASGQEATEEAPEITETATEEVTEETTEGSDTVTSEETTTEEATTEEVTTEDPTLAAQSVDDGVKYVGFADTIQVMETYVNSSQITDKDTAYTTMTTKNAEASIYVVEPGDALSLIAEKNNLTVDEIKALNPQIESDDDIYYDDRLNITVPKAALQILVEKQETYRENYNEDVVYQDDDSMFIGESEVVQEGTPGSHVVTDLVTYTDDMESDRKELKETVEVAAVAQVVKRGTKSKPTYMYPVTNWNITSNFGYRWGRLHAGTDVGIPTGTTVRASRAGQVITAGWVGGYGNCVIIDHGDGVSTRYGHLSEVTVSVGQYVDQGQQIALSGNTGRSTGPHLHFEIRINGEAVDPLPYLAGQQ